MKAKHRELSLKARNVADSLGGGASKGRLMLILVALHEARWRTGERKRPVVNAHFARGWGAAIDRVFVVLVYLLRYRVIFLLHLTIAVRVHEATLLVVV